MFFLYYIGTVYIASLTLRLDFDSIARTHRDWCYYFKLSDFIKKIKYIRNLPNSYVLLMVRAVDKKFELGKKP